MNKLFKVLLLLSICLGVGISCAAAVSAASPVISLSPQTFSLQPGATQTVQIVMDEVPSAGLAGFNITISIQNQDVAEITGVTFPDWATLHSNSSFPSSSGWIQAIDLSNKVTAGNNNVILGTITLKGKEDNTSDITLSSKDVEDENGELLTVDFNKGIINHQKPTPEIIWSIHANITYGTPLDSTQLNATAKDPDTSSVVTGTYNYTPPAGTVLSTGTHMLNVEFIPTDTASYTNASKDVSINVGKVTPTIIWTNPANITVGTALNGTQLNAVASIPGTLVYTPPAGTILDIGTHKLNVTFTPTDVVNYTKASEDVTINVTEKKTPIITWSNPADMTYGTPLGATQLNAVAKDPKTGATVSGQFVYTPPAGTILGAGTQTLHVEFKPTDTASYNSATGDATINVIKVISTITWSNPANITNGTALNGTQLNAVASVPGTYVYNPPAGTILDKETHKLNVTFTPTDVVNYTTASKDVTINVTEKKTPIITWNNPDNITVGTALNGTQLNAVASVPGTLVYTPAAGAKLDIGKHTLHVEFTPTETASYTNASKEVTINVTGNPIPQVKADFDFQVTDLTVKFTYKSTCTPVQWNWDFGDGNTSTIQNPEHIYAAARNFTVTLSVQNDDGNTDKISKNIAVIGPVNDQLKAVIDATPTSGTAPLTVQFKDKSTNATSIKWDFGDKSGTSTRSNPGYTYKAAGTYTVTLTAYNGEKSDIAKKIITVNFVVLKINAIKANVTSGYEPLTVRFSSDVSSKPISYTWIINKQIIKGSTNGKITYTFTKAGKYDVTLIVKDASRHTFSVSKSGFITVLPRVKPPVAAFSATPTSGKAPLTVRFIDKSQNKPDTWKWNLGDGSTSYKLNPTHYYKYPGKYTVTLTVKNKGGSSTKTIKNYIVSRR